MCVDGLLYCWLGCLLCYFCGDGVSVILCLNLDFFCNLLVLVYAV